MILADKVAFVTGGSKGIGRAIAIGLAQAGAAVALTGRSAGEGEGTAGATAMQIAASGGRALPLVCDVRDEADVRAAIGRSVESFGRLDILINNAGLYFPGVDAIEQDFAQWRETIDTHINGTFLCARAVAPHLVAAGGGSIVNLSSTAGDAAHDSSGNLAYAVAKAGIEQLTRGLARELARHDIAVNAIRPMALLSEGSIAQSNWLERYLVRSGGQSPYGGMTDAERMQRFSDPSAIVPAILHLSQCRAGFSGHIVRRTDFDGVRFTALL